MTALYVAGPMRLMPEFNFPVFELARTRLRAVGYGVTCPAEMDEANGFDPTGLLGDEPLDTLDLDLRTVLRRDIEAVFYVDGIATLHGWEDSTGATAEVSLGRALGLPVMSVDEWIADTLRRRKAGL